MKILDSIFIAVGILGLIGVRMIETHFYDPFLEYFHTANKKATFPDFDWGKLILNYLLRFLLNFIFSLTVIHFIFKKRAWTVQAGVLILLVFAVIFPVYLYCIYTRFEIGYLFSFYIRRFVIQPLLLLLIIPLFYYRKKVSL